VDGLLQDIIQLLITLGPVIVFLVTAAETAVFLGLLAPSGATVLAAAFMADLGYFELEHVLLATLLGGFTGDQVGYALGRFGGRGVAARVGLLGRMWRRHEARATLLFRQQSLLAVTLSRFIAFVRTLMPWFAGMTGMSYPRFLFYDVLGVLGWGISTVALGYLAGRSWQAVAGTVGTVSSIIVVTLLGVALWFGWRTRQRMRSVLRVALTGNIASGKSAVAAIWKNNGAAIIDADELAREAVLPGTTGLRAVVARFGAGVLNEDGTLNRAALRDIVFQDEKKRRQLEDILHPEIERLRRAAERRAVDDGERLIVHAIPLLFEKSMQDMFDVVVMVDAPEDVRLGRLVDTRGLAPAQAKEMIAAQAPTADKRAHARYIIENDGTLEELAVQAEEVWAEIESRPR
jgi:dephospho-CoA kinase